MRVLVTGGAGFIGSNLVDRLVDIGDDVAVIDNLSSGKRGNLASALDRGVELHKLDVIDGQAIKSVFSSLKPDVVFHFAAQIDVRKAFEDPALDARTNIQGTVNVLDASVWADVKRFVFISTGGALYGDTDELPTTEKCPVTPLSPYGVSKAAAESYCWLYSRLHRLSSVSLRLANVYGPRQDLGGESGVIAIFTDAARRKQSVVPVYGDGQQTRDYVYVGDVVDSCLHAVRTTVVGALNIGTGIETSVLDLLEELDLEPEFLPSRPGEIVRSCLSSVAAKERLGWCPRTTLREGLERTRAWAETQPGEL